MRQCREKRARIEVTVNYQVQVTSRYPVTSMNSALQNNTNGCMVYVLLTSSLQKAEHHVL